MNEECLGEAIVIDPFRDGGEHHQRKAVRMDEWEALDRKVKFLKSVSLESIETHLSWVFLTESLAYKLKKPVHFSYLDHSTIKSRQRDAEREVLLNQQLAPGYYLGAMPLMLDGKVTDWLVVMKRFPRELTLIEKISELKTDDPLLESAAQALTRFYLDSAPVPIGPQEYVLRLERYVKENLLALSRPRYGLERDIVSQVHEWQLEILFEYREHFYQRVREGRIIEAHGDLRPEHICLTDPPILVDRLEFSQELRTMDPVDELSYLTLECALLGRPDIGEVFFRAYRSGTNDDIENEVISFYRSFRAALRAKISLWHLDDPRVLVKKKHINKGERYLKLAKWLLEQSGDSFLEVPPETHLTGRVSWHGQRG